MRTVPIYAGLAALVAVSSATPHKVDKLHMKLTHRNHKNKPASHIHRKKASSTTVPRPIDLNSQWVPYGGYFIDISVGTPPQDFSVQLDTGSADFFVPSVHADNCQKHLCPGGTFDSSQSSTFQYAHNAPAFKITYDDGSKVVGDYAKDTVTLGKAVLDGFTFSVANQIQVSPGDKDGGAQYGILGVAFQADQTSSCPTDHKKKKKTKTKGRNKADDNCFNSPMIFDALYDAGYSGARSYALALDRDSGGSILFGGTDNTKYTGDLVSLNVLKNHNGVYIDLDLRLIGVSSTTGGNTQQLGDGTALSRTTDIDSGTDTLGLPTQIYNQVLGQLSTFETDDGTLALYCDQSSTDYTLSVQVAGSHSTPTASIDIPLKQLLMPLHTGNYNSTTPLTKHGRDVCVFAIEEAKDDDLLILGSPLFRAAYLNFDFDQDTISIAQRNV